MVSAVPYYTVVVKGFPNFASQQLRYGLCLILVSDLWIRWKVWQLFDYVKSGYECSWWQYYCIYIGISKKKNEKKMILYNFSCDLNPLKGHQCLKWLSISVNHYKCPLCDMTCPHPSAVRNHIKYRHAQDRLHMCAEGCGYAWVIYWLPDCKQKITNKPFKIYFVPVSAIEAK